MDDLLVAIGEAQVPDDDLGVARLMLTISSGCAGKRAATMAVALTSSTEPSSTTAVAKGMDSFTSGTWVASV